MGELLLKPTDDIGSTVALDRHVARRGNKDLESVVFCAHPKSQALSPPLSRNDRHRRDGRPRRLHSAAGLSVTQEALGSAGSVGNHGASWRLTLERFQGSASTKTATEASG
jgi:hypothetical protein